MKKIIAITGASGFIGNHLVKELLKSGDYRIKLLSRNGLQEHSFSKEADVEVVIGDLLQPQSLNKFLEEDCIVVNLVYLWNGGDSENVTAILNLLQACKTANIKRLLHCSTAAVVGRVNDDIVTEQTDCRPITDYGITKLKIEHIVSSMAKDNFDLAILRPTSVFGVDGKPLKKLTKDLTTRNKKLTNYLRSCLFGKRRMNLVCIENVVSSIIYLINYPKLLKNEIFIISDDDSPFNNFSDVERFLMQKLEIRDYVLSPLHFPYFILKLLLACLGRNNINPHTIYSSYKLQSIGFERVISFETGLAKYASWYKAFIMIDKKA
ncbi:MAG TPA: NAD(P)-dependent oxidoreductase [Methylotenera sp.]|nr:NAD(P)-dependent oxidoreductase [Methylotenera sp.]